MPLFTLTHLTHQYNNRLVLNVPQLEIHAGEIFCLLGPSGAGKSTLLRLLNFLETPTQGEVRYQDQTAPSLALTRQITTVFQRPTLLTRSVYANVAYSLQLRGDYLNGQIDHALAQVGLTSLAQQTATQLSGGEMQRVALARALVLAPTVLLLDEPTANLDPYNAQLIETIIKEQNTNHHTTIVWVTHNIFQAKRLAQRVGFILNGQLIEVATAEKFFYDPQEDRTRAFLNGELVY